MNTKTFMRGFLAISIALTAKGYSQEENVVLDQTSGNYIITYMGFDLNNKQVLHRVVYIPATKIEPEVKSQYRETETGAFSYRYKVRNGTRSKQDIDGFNLVASNVKDDSKVSPDGWRGGVSSHHAGTGFIAGWFFKSQIPLGIPPGKSQGGFGIDSNDLPGISIMKISGGVPVQGFPDEGPDPQTAVGKEVHQILTNDFVPRPAAVPKISVPTPFDAAVVLAGVQKHLNQDLVSMKLVDPVFAGQLDRLLQTAVQAAKQGNTPGLKSNLQDLRRLLKREHEDVDKEDKDDRWDDEEKSKPKSKLIDKLAAKVLDFDLKYVLKRVGEKS